MHKACVLRCRADTTQCYTSNMNKTRVGVVRGGTSSEYDVSLKTGRAVMDALPEEQYDVRDIFIDKEGTWYSRGIATEPLQVFPHTDVIFNALHGTYGEDGTLQRLLDAHHIPYTGSDALGSAIGMNKVLAKQLLHSANVRHAPHHILEESDYSEAVLAEIFHSFPLPVVVKPVTGGSSVGTTLAYTFDDLHLGVLSGFGSADRVMIENYVRGRELTVAVVEDFRGEDIYAFPPIEIVPSNESMFDYEEKYSGRAHEICPARLDITTKQTLMNIAREVHGALGLRDYSRTDLILSPEGIFFLEVNTLPGLTPTSLVPQAVEAVGSNLPEFLNHLVTRALSRS